MPRNILKGRFASIGIMLWSLFFSTCTIKEADHSSRPAVSPINLSHALTLVDSLTIDHHTIAFIYIYAEAPDYWPVEAQGEGVTCVDDVGRFLEVLETEINDNKVDSLRHLAASLTWFLLRMDNPDGTWYNFMWRDGSINDTHVNSTAEFGWWAVRGLRGLAAAYNIFSGQSAYSHLALKIETAIHSADQHILSSLNHYPAQVPRPWGTHPKWLLKDAPDMSSELLLVLTKLHLSRNFNYQNEITKLAEGLVLSQISDPESELLGMYLCWENTWHAWGNNQAFSLLQAYLVTGDSLLLKSVQLWADSFIPFWYKSNLPFAIELNEEAPHAYTDFPQIAYGITSIYRGVQLLADLTGQSKYQDLADLIFSWYEGKNAANHQMYDPLTGRGYDGIRGQTDVNINSGAESTIESLLAFQMRELSND